MSTDICTTPEIIGDLFRELDALDRRQEAIAAAVRGVPVSDGHGSMIAAQAEDARAALVRARFGLRQTADQSLGADQMDTAVRGHLSALASCEGLVARLEPEVSKWKEYQARATPDVAAECERLRGDIRALEARADAVAIPVRERGLVDSLGGLVARYAVESLDELRKVREELLRFEDRPAPGSREEIERFVRGMESEVRSQQQRLDWLEGQHGEWQRGARD